MIRLYPILYCLLILLASCQKNEAVPDESFARQLWGSWEVFETKKIYQNIPGFLDTLILDTFQMSFSYNNSGGIQNGLSFLWAIQEDPDGLLISYQSLNFNGVRYYKTDFHYIGEFSMDTITLHNEFLTHNDSVNITTERNWIMVSK